MQTVTVTANSAADPTKQATAIVTLVPPQGVAVTPLSVRLAEGQQQQFAASVQNTSNQSVTWSVSPAVGSISSQGVYIAPAIIAASQTVTVTATSTANTALVGSATVTLVPPITAAVSVTGTSGSLVHTAQISVTVN